MDGLDLRSGVSAFPPLKSRSKLSGSGSNPLIVCRQPITMSPRYFTVLIHKQEAKYKFTVKVGTWEQQFDDGDNDDVDGDDNLMTRHLRI